MWAIPFLWPARRWPWRELYGPLYATVGIHPHDARRSPGTTWRRCKNWPKNPRWWPWGRWVWIFIATCLLPGIQEKVFREQLQLAKELRLPVVVHDRDAHQRVLQILKEEKAGDTGGVLHCFSGDLRMARECFELGLYISIAGPVTYKKASPCRRLPQPAPGTGCFWKRTALT
jgi:TatD DNase family protein